MVEIIGFPALRYAPTRVGSLAGVIAPPYDVIDDEELRRLWASGPHNAVRLILPAGDLPPAERSGGYGLAAERLRAWKEQGILVPDPQPSIYLYRQRFTLPGEGPRVRQGFFALVRLTGWGAGIHPHEGTLPGPVCDRLQLLEACQANLGSIFGLYADPQQEVMAALLEGVDERAPAAEGVDGHGIWHGLWPVSEPGVLRRVTSLLRQRPVVVADGHHRYTAALTYRDRKRAADGAAGQVSPWDYALFCLYAFEEPGLVVLPTHQVVAGLRGFDADRLAAEPDLTGHELPSLAALLEALARPAPADVAVVGVVVRGPRYRLLELERPAQPATPEEALDVSLLRRRLVEPLLRRHGAGTHLEPHLRYSHQAEQAAAWVVAGQADVAFLVRPTPLDQVRAVALAGRLMPQKSTYFYPKVYSGLVFYDHTVWTRPGA